MSATPRAVRKQAAEADRLLKELSAKPGETPPEAPPPTTDNMAPAAAPTPPAVDNIAPAAAPTPPPAEPMEDFKQRYTVLKGKYDKEIAEMRVTIAEQAEQIRSLESLVEQATAARPTPTFGKAPESKLIKQEEEEEYGKEFFDVVGRRAREIIDAELAPLRDKLQSAASREVKLTEEQKRINVQTALDEQVPNWGTLNTDSRFLAWLAERDVFSGEVKQVLLTKAFQAGDAARVVGFFKAFQEDSSGTPTPGARNPSVDPGTLVAPGTAKSGAGPMDAPGGARVWTQAEISAFYADVRRGKVPAERKAQLEADIIRAAAEGRVR
jgi:hypothetical protein